MRWPICDPQAVFLHRAEKEFYPKRKHNKNYSGKIKWSEATQLTCKVRKQFALPPVRVCGSGPNKTDDQAWVDFYVHDDGEIDRATVVIDTRYAPLSTITLLHELTHVIVEHYFEGVEDHGREFVGVLSWLYDHYRVIPADAFGLILRRHGVKRRPLRFCSPEILCGGG